MTYPELDSLDSTPDQDLGLTIAFKLAVADRSLATSPGDYLRIRVLELLDGFVGQHVIGVQKSRIETAFAQATDQEKADVAAALKIDLTVVVPVKGAIDAEAKP